MDRKIVYPAQIPMVEDQLESARFTQIGLGRMAAALFGEGGLGASGLACAVDSDMNVSVAPGQIIQSAAVDATSYGVLAADSDVILTQYLLSEAVTVAVPGVGQTYIIYGTPSISDTDTAVLPFYNSADPSQVYAGPDNNGASTATTRASIITVGIGTSVPSGSVPLWQIVVPPGTSTITSDMISQAPGAPIYPNFTEIASRIVAPFNSALAQAFGGYPLNAIVCDSATAGTFWVSTAAANTSTPGATGASWQSLFEGYATEDWSNDHFIPLTGEPPASGGMTVSGIMITPQRFGAVGDGSTDDTAAFRAAIAYLVNRGGGTLWLPRAHYVLSSEFDTSTGQNSLLPLPSLVNGTNELVPIRIVGESCVSAFGPPNPTTGVVISTPNTASTSNGIIPSIIGYGSASSTITWTMLTLQIENVAFKVPANSGITAIDAYACANCILQNVSVVVDESPSDITAPTVTTFTAIKLPGTGCYGVVKAKNVYVSGFYYGIQHSEHADIEALINLCVYALYIPDSYSHLAKYKVTTQQCSYSVRCSAQASSSFGFANSVFGTLDIERDPNFQFAADFFIDPGAILNGTLFYNVAADPQSLYSVWGSGTFNVAVQNVAYHSLTVTGDATVNPNGLFYPVIPNDLTAAATLTIRQGLVKGQRIRVYGYYDYDIQVNSIVTTGSPAFYFPDNSKSYGYTIPSGEGGPQYIELTWNGQDWFVITEGKKVVANATDYNHALALGQFSSDVQSTFTLTPGTVMTNIYKTPITVYVALTIPAGATASLRMGPDSSSLIDVWSATTANGGDEIKTTGSIRIPSGWYYELYTTSGVTLGQSLSVQF